MTYELEHINPHDIGYKDFWIKIEHIGRYLFARDFIKSHKYIKNVYDVACGSGYGSILLAEQNVDVFAFDNNSEIINSLKVKYANQNRIKFICQCLAKQPFTNVNEEDKLGLIVCFETLEHLMEPRKLLSEFYNVLDENGYLMLSVPNEKYELVDENLVPLGKFHKVLLSKFRIEKYLKDQGFEIIGRFGQALLKKLVKRENRLFKKNI